VGTKGGLPDLPVIQRHGEGVYVFPGKNCPTSLPSFAVAGPFRDAMSAKLWILERLEAGLTESQRTVWSAVVPKLGGVSFDLGLELSLIQLVKQGRTVAQLDRFIPWSSWIVPPSSKE
jgi:hypothetical protein